MAAPMRKVPRNRVFRQFLSESLFKTNSNVSKNTGSVQLYRMQSSKSPKSGKSFGKSVGAGLAIGLGAGAVIGLAIRSMPKEIIPREKIQPTKVVKNSSTSEDGLGVKLTLFQFVTCPFCCKVRAMLDYHGINYNVVEVNSVTRKETKWTDYTKVPILVCDGVGSKGFLQLNDSSLIMSILESYIFDRSVSLETFYSFYPGVTSKTRKKTTFDYPNRYFIMYQENVFDNRTPDQRKEERMWRKWVDDKFVHTISPNVYRTLRESYTTFQWFSKAGEWESIFDNVSRMVVIYSGALVMYFIGRRLKKKYQLREDVRASLYDHCDVFVKGLKGKDFIGGDKPNLADLSMYGVLTSIEGTEAFKDMIDNCKIGPWFERTKKAVLNHEGASRLVQKS